MGLGRFLGDVLQGVAKEFGRIALCDYNDETLVSNSLVCRAQEKRHVSRISRQAR